MSQESRAVTLAKTWLELWNKGEPERLPLTEDFVHSSPFGKIQGRQNYLEWVIPLARKNVTRLAVIKTLGNADEAVIQFEMHTPEGIVPVCDWITVEGDKITSIHSFYDATGLR